MIPMNVKINKEDKKSITLELSKTDLGLVNALKEELWRDSNVNVAGSKTEHPLIDKLFLIVETDGKTSPKKAVLNAIKKLKDTNDKFKKEFVKVAK